MRTSIERYDTHDVQVAVRVQSLSATRVTHVAGAAAWSLVRVALGLCLLLAGTVAGVLGALAEPLSDAGERLIGGGRG